MQRRQLHAEPHRCRCSYAVHAIGAGTAAAQSKTIRKWTIMVSPLTFAFPPFCLHGGRNAADEAEAIGGVKIIVGRTANWSSHEAGRRHRGCGRAGC